MIYTIGRSFNINQIAKKFHLKICELCRLPKKLIGKNWKFLFKIKFRLSWEYSNVSNVNLKRKHVKRKFQIFQKLSNIFGSNEIESWSSEMTSVTDGGSNSACDIYIIFLPNYISFVSDCLTKRSCCLICNFRLR